MLKIRAAFGVDALLCFKPPSQSAMTMSVQSTTCTRGFIPNARNIHYWLFSRALAAIWRGPTLKTRASPSCRNVPTVLIWPVRCVRRWLRLYPGFRQQPATPVSKSPRQPHPVRGSQGPALSTSMLAYRPLRLSANLLSKTKRSSYSHRKTKHPPLDPTHIKQGPDHS